MSKNISLDELRNKLKNTKNEPIFVVFHATWCKYCLENIPFAKQYLENKIIKNLYYIDVSNPSLDVWAETGNKEWALELVPSYRIYQNTELVFEHKNIIDEEKINNAFNIYLEYEKSSK